MKALVIEDNDRLRKSVLDYLRDEGFAADAAADGEEGFYKATNWDYDVIVLDVMIPPPDGFELLRKLRATGRTTPVLMLTARSGLVDRLRGLNTGADDYLVKPFEMEELVARVRSVIRRSKHAPNRSSRLGRSNSTRPTARLAWTEIPWNSPLENMPCSKCWWCIAMKSFPAMCSTKSYLMSGTIRSRTCSMSISTNSGKKSAKI